MYHGNKKTVSKKKTKNNKKKKGTKKSGKQRRTSLCDWRINGRRGKAR